jgi:hypothetical protein
MVAVIWVEELALMLRAVVVPLRFQFTTGEPGKLVPVRVSVIFAEGLTIAKVGLMEVSVGPWLMVKAVVAPGVPVAVLITPTWAVPAVARRPEGTVAVNWVPLT